MFKIARSENFRQASVTQRNEEACSFSDKLASKTCTVCKNQETGEKNAPWFAKRVGEIIWNGSVQF